MTTSKDLLLAILSMDAYNRGYGAGVTDGDNNDPDGLGDAIDTQIGSATVSGRSSSDPNSDEVNAGFYAISYNTPYGTVISYRGTDNPISFANLNPWSDAQGSDIWNGYGSAGGAPNTNQAHLAANFFQAVTGTSDGDPRTGSATLVGHSLGGGLAGLIGAMYRQQAVLFDNMPFELAANRAYALASTPLVSTVNNLIWGDFYNSLDAWAPQIGDNLKTIAVTGEFLTATRQLQSTPQNYIDSNGGLRNPVALHSQALLVNLQYAKDNQLVDWYSIGPELLDALFTEEIAEQAGFDEAGVNGHYSPAYKQLAAIAYSAIDEGTRVFGDTGIRSMFDDANELGYVYNSNLDSLRDPWLNGSINDGWIWDTSIKQQLAAIAVQYAGALAENEVTQANQPHATKGVLALSQPKDILALDLSSVLWEDTLGTNITPVKDILFKDSFFGQVAGKSVSEVKAILDRLAVEVWEADDNTIFDRFQMRTIKDLATVYLADRSYEVTATSGPDVHVDVYIGLQDKANDNRSFAGRLAV